MRKGKFLGKKVVMSDKHWELCLKRVDVTRAKEDRGMYQILVPCPFCSAEYRGCGKCSLAVFAKVGVPDWGCVRLFKLVMKKVGVKTFPALFDDYVSWNTYDDEDSDARKILKFIHKGLLKMKEVRR